MADYGVVAMTYIARQPGAMHTATSVAEETGVPLPSASKLLKALARGEILSSQRGAKGGYSLAKPPAEISVAEIVVALDGPISLADCLDGPSGTCGLESFCVVRGPWQKVSEAIRVALEEVSLADMIASLSEPPPAASTSHAPATRPG
jgi:FeS assembly SUF system regulator